MDFPKKQAQRLMPLYLLEYSEKLFTNHPDPSAPWGGGGGSDYTAGQGITITNNEISVDTNVIASKNDLNDYIKNNDTSYLSIFRGQYAAVKDEGSYNTTIYGDGAIKKVVPHQLPYGDHAYTYSLPDKAGTIALTSDLPSLSGYATEEWVQNQGYLTNASLNNYVTLDTEQAITGSKTFTSNLYIKSTNSTTCLGLEDYSLYFEDTSSGEVFQILPYKKTLGPGFYFGVGEDALAMNYYVLPHQDLPGEYHYTLATTNDIPSLTGYATETWVQNQGYITNAALNNYVTTTQLNDAGYATETWVQNQGYATSSEIPTNYVTTDTEQTITGLKTIGETSGTISEVDFSGFTFKLSNKAINNPEADIKIHNSSYNGYQYPTIYSSKGLYVNLAKIKLGDDGNNTYGITMPDSSTWESDRVLATTNDIPTVNNPTITFTQGGTTKGTITLNQSGDQTIEFDAGASLPDSPFLKVEDPQDQMFFSLDGSDSSWYKYVNLSDAHNKMFYVNLSALNPVFKDGLTSTYNEQTNQLEVGLNAVIPTKTSDLFNDSGYVTSSSLATVATTGSYNDLTDKPSIPSTATSTSTSTVTPTTGTFVTGTSTNTADVVNSVTYTPSSETLTFTYADNTTASFTFLTSSTTVTSGTTSVVTSVTDSTSNAMTGATVSTSTTTTLS